MRDWVEYVKNLGIVEIKRRMTILAVVAVGASVFGGEYLPEYSIIWYVDLVAIVVPSVFVLFYYIFLYQLWLRTNRSKA